MKRLQYFFILKTQHPSVVCGHHSSGITNVPWGQQARAVRVNKDFLKNFTQKNDGGCFEWAWCVSGCDLFSIHGSAAGSQA
jgi:hypothetical protein